MKYKLIITICATLYLVNMSNAAVINIAPGNVTASSEIGGGFNRQDDFIVNGNGLNGSGEHDTGANNVAWLSTGTNFGGDDPDPSVTFDLGALYRISSFNVWNYNENATGSQMLRGVNGVTVEYGATAGLGSTVAGITNFQVATGLNNYIGEDFSSFTPFVARFIRFDINSNHGGDNNFYGLSEVQFDGVPVPEPSSTLLLGLSGIALLLRRQRK